MVIYYSKTTGGFFPDAMRGDYERAGTWPSDAVKLTAQETETFHLKIPPTGYQLGSDETGRPKWIKVPVSPLTDRRNVAKRAIDDAAGAARQRFVSTGTLIDMEYKLAQEQTAAWRAAGSPADNVPDAITSWAAAAGMTDEEAAADIEATAIAWEQVLIGVRQIRLAGKAAVDAAADQGTADDMMNVAQPYIDQLDALAP